MISFSKISSKNLSIIYQKRAKNLPKNIPNQIQLALNLASSWVDSLEVNSSSSTRLFFLKNLNLESDSVYSKKTYFESDVGDSTRVQMVLWQLFLIANFLTLWSLLLKN